LGDLFGRRLSSASAKLYRAVRLRDGNRLDLHRRRPLLLEVELVRDRRADTRRVGAAVFDLTVALLPFCRFVTFAVVPSGKFLLAATFDCGFIGCPSAIFR
jgi:hypothetical protein